MLVGRTALDGWDADERNSPLRRIPRGAWGDAGRGDRVGRL